MYLQLSWTRIFVISLIYCLCFVISLGKAQNVIVEELDSTSIELIRANNWELYYSTSLFDIATFYISEQAVVFQTMLSNRRSELYLFDKSLIQRKYKSLPELKMFPLTIPAFQYFDDKVYFGAYNGRYYVVNGHTFKKKGRVISYPESAGKFTFQGIYKKGVGSEVFVGFMDFDSKSGTQHFELILKRKKSEFNIFSASFETNMTMLIGTFKLFDFSVDAEKIIVLDAISNFLLLYKDTLAIDKLNIENLVNSQITPFYKLGSKIRLLQDDKTKINYLLIYLNKSAVLFEIKILENNFKLDEIGEFDFYSSSVQIYDNAIYSLFRMKHDKSYSIFRKEIR